MRVMNEASSVSGTKPSVFCDTWGFFIWIFTDSRKSRHVQQIVWLMVNSISSVAIVTFAKEYMGKTHVRLHTTKISLMTNQMSFRQNNEYDEVVVFKHKQKLIHILCVHHFNWMFSYPGGLCLTFPLSSRVPFSVYKALLHLYIHHSCNTLFVTVK